MATIKNKKINKYQSIMRAKIESTDYINLVFFNNLLIIFFFIIAAHLIACQMVYLARVTIPLHDTARTIRRAVFIL